MLPLIIFIITGFCILVSYFFEFIPTFYSDSPYTIQYENKFHKFLSYATPISILITVFICSVAVIYNRYLSASPPENYEFPTETYERTEYYEILLESEDAAFYQVSVYPDRSSENTIVNAVKRNGSRILVRVAYNNDHEFELFRESLNDSLFFKSLNQIPENEFWSAKSNSGI
jgi:hypothetical protein